LTKNCEIINSIFDLYLIKLILSQIIIFPKFNEKNDILIISYTSYRMGFIYTDRFIWMKWYQQTEWSITNDSRRRNWTKKREIFIIFIFVPPNYYGTSYFPSVVTISLKFKKVGSKW